MPIVNLPSIGGGDDPSMEDVINAFERLRKELTWLLDKNIDTKNARELGGWLIRPDKIVSNDGDVGMSTLDTAADDIRFFAGPDGTSWFFYVTKSGKLYATDGFFTGRVEGSVIVGSEIMTDEPGNYPRAAMSSIDALFSAEQSADEFMRMVSNYFGEVSLLINSATVSGLIQPLGNDLFISTFFNNGNIQISSGEDLLLYAAFGKFVRIKSWGTFYGEDDSQTLQQALNAKQDDITSGDITVIGGAATLNSGISATKIASGVVDNTEFQALNGVTSNIQTQLDGKLATSGGKFLQEGSTNVTVVTANVGVIQFITFATPYASGIVPKVYTQVTDMPVNNAVYLNILAYGAGNTGFYLIVNCQVAQTISLNWEARG